jgi:hypothetical protein
VASPKVSACVFCSSPAKLTKEHLIPAWAWRVAGPGLPVQHFVSRFYEETGRTVRAHGPLHRSGGIQRHAKIVCSACNNEWMSALEDAAIPTVGRLSVAHLSILSTEERRVLAAWVALKFMVLEFADPASAITTADLRSDLKNELSVPPFWTIFVGRYVGSERQPQFWHRALTFDREALAANRRLTPSSMAHISLVGWSGLLFFGICPNGADAARNLFLTQKLSYENLGLRQIWPDASNPLAVIGRNIDETVIELIMANFLGAPPPFSRS